MSSRQRLKRKKGKEVLSAGGERRFARRKEKVTESKQGNCKKGKVTPSPRAQKGKRGGICKIRD